jgi:hypothetical protein
MKWIAIAFTLVGLAPVGLLGFTSRALASCSDKYCFGINSPNYGKKSRLTCTKQESNCFRANANSPELLVKCEPAHKQCLRTGVWIGPRVTLSNLEKR